MLKAKQKANKSNNMNDVINKTNTSVYNNSGINAEAVSTNVEKKKEIQKDKPPEVEHVPKKQQKVTIQSTTFVHC